MSTLHENMRVEHFTSNPPEKRVATHSHIKGLGLSPDGTAEPIKAGFVGQENAREVNLNMLKLATMNLIKICIYRLVVLLLS
jgi:DNA helicase TIP49 (TBP-interacting protein)